jgi:hypothetical protein
MEQESQTILDTGLRLAFAGMTEISLLDELELKSQALGVYPRPGGCKTRPHEIVLRLPPVPDF